MPKRLFALIATGVACLYASCNDKSENFVERSHREMRERLEAAKHAPPASPQPAEIDVNKYLLKSPKSLRSVFGRVRDRAECVDVEGDLLEFDRAYVCLQKGVVVLISYEMKTSVTSPEQALSAVGLMKTAHEEEIRPHVYVWSKQYGNAIAAAGRRATSVWVFMNNNRRTPTVNVNMAWEPGAGPQYHLGPKVRDGR
jgi:hypothetical protein